MNKILGLDLGTNSIGWALVDSDDHRILGMGSRIIPMSQDILGDFDKGNSVSQTASRTSFRSIRRLRERHLLRRDRLHRILNILGFLPEHYVHEVDFGKRLGQFIDCKEPKIAYHEKQFLFKESFTEMLQDFKKNQPELLNRKNKKGQDAKIPYDWTIYYLRKKGLSQKLMRAELAWILLNFNQKRGYYQLRGEEEEENTNKSVEFHSLKIVDVIADGKPNTRGDLWYSLHLENGWIYRRSSKVDLADLKNKVRDFIVTTDLNDDGTVKKDKEGAGRRSFRAPGEDDWTLLKKKTEQEIEKSNKTVGAYIYDTLLKKPNQKIRGKLVRTVERKFYKDELAAILTKQIKLQPELFTDDLYNDCVRELYRHNYAHQRQLSQRGFVDLFVDDIIFYQRPLKSKKSSIGKCPLEFREYASTNDEGRVREYVKAIPKSHPLYQEFRVWQWLFNLKIYRKEDDVDVTLEFITGRNDLERLYEFLMSKKEVNHVDILKHVLGPRHLTPKELKAETAKYRWNYVFDDTKEKEDEKSKQYPCNETGYEIRRRLEMVESLPSNFLTTERELQLWHIIYSVIDKDNFEKALRSFARKHGLDEVSFVQAFKKFKPFESDYGSYSEKAIKKLLPLMRLGRHWNWDAIDARTRSRIEKILTGEFDDQIKGRVRDKAIHLTENDHFQGLQLWLAQYIVYNRHSEDATTVKWNSVTELEEYLNNFKQHSLRNPIVEQVVTETLRVVRDIWIKYGSGVRNYFDEIHVELGREMKNTAEERKQFTNQISDNENTNLRIKALIAELKNDPKIENVRPQSPTQQEALKIFEEGVLTSVRNKLYKESETRQKEEDEAMLKIGATAQPTKSELQRYKLWLEQKYRSPYTGEFIPLSKLFTSAYEIEHVIPQSRYFDDSLSNKVICETVVNGNPYKDNQLGLEFIKNQGGRIVDELSRKGKIVKIFTENEYRDFVKQHYEKNKGKRTRLLLEDIPDKMIQRQLNDTRYISKFISNLLSNIVRTDNGDDGVNSKNLIASNGRITSMLRQDWGLNHVWNQLILPRFQRMNELTGSTAFTARNKEGHAIPAIPLEFSKGFQKKRIDHRHHAMDALVVACATRDHVNLLNNQSAKSDSMRYDLQRKLRNIEKWVDKEGKERVKFTEFKKPWNSFTDDTRNELEKIVVSFKQNVRVINKTTNKYESYNDEKGKLRIGKDGQPKKGFVSQTKGDSWAVRKPMHKDTVSGKVNLPWVKVPNGKILTATRKSVDISFNLKTIESITDTGIQKILKNYLASRLNNPEVAFSPEGLEEMNKNIPLYNDGKPHQPIYKARIFELGSKFPLGLSGNKQTKYVEAAKGTNLFFAVYEGANNKRTFESIPLNIVIERQKQGLTSVPETNERGEKLLFHLSPNDLVYVPSEDEKHNLYGLDFGNLSKEQLQNAYKIVSFTGPRLYGVPLNVASVIVNKVEYTQLNKIEFINEKEYCVKLKVDRLGNLSKG